jgi:hypothetical protein
MTRGGWCRVCLRGSFPLLPVSCTAVSLEGAQYEYSFGTVFWGRAR